MRQAMLRLMDKADMLRAGIPLILFVAGFIGLPAERLGGGRTFLLLVLALLFLWALAATLRSLYERAQRLLSGRCPYPLCHGTVHHSERVPKGYLLCVTCGKVWPEVPGIKFRATA